MTYFEDAIGLAQAIGMPCPPDDRESCWQAFLSLQDDGWDSQSICEALEDYARWLSDFALPERMTLLEFLERNRYGRVNPFLAATRGGK